MPSFAMSLTLFSCVSHSTCLAVFLSASAYAVYIVNLSHNVIIIVDFVEILGCFERKRNLHLLQTTPSIQQLLIDVSLL